MIPNVPNVVYTPTLFQSFGQAAAQGFGAQVEQVAPNMGSAATAAFNQAFQAASAALAQTEQQSLADFNSARATVLANTAAVAKVPGITINQGEDFVVTPFEAELAEVA
mgnify:CR=1 FL=1